MNVAARSVESPAKIAKTGEGWTGSNKVLRVLQWNADGVNTKRAELDQCLEK